MVQYRSPFAGPLAPGLGGTPLVERVVLVVVDGLRLDASRTMNTLTRLREQGADFTAWTGEPSLSYPGWTVIASGATQEVSGVTTNWYKGPARVDDLFAAAKRAGMETAVAGSPGWAMLFPSVTRRVLVEDPPGYTALDAMYRTSDEAAAGALEIVKDGTARLVLVHFPSVDLLGHGFGGASPEYAEAVRRVDAHIASILQAVDLSTTALVITSDHGHIDTGGHGGWEPVVKQTPLVLAGAGVRHGVRGGDVRQADIAPTVAVLLGLSFPAHNQGRPLAEAIDGDPREFGRRWAEQQHALYSYIGGYLNWPALAGLFSEPKLAALADHPDGIAAFSDDIALELFQARTARLELERARRLPIAVAVAVIPAIYLLFHRRKWLLLPALLGAAVFFGVDYGLFYGRGYTFSLSVFNTESMILAFFNRRLVDGAIAICVAGLVSGLFAARGTMGEAARAGLDMGYLVAYALLLQVLYFYWLWDVQFAWYLPDLRLGFKFYLDLLKLVPVGFLGAGYMLVAVAARGLGRAIFRTR